MYRNLTNKLKTKWCSKISEGILILVKFSRYVKIDFVHYLEDEAKNKFNSEILLPLTLIEKKQKTKTK